MKTNYHTHIYLCRHASGTIDDYVKKAIEKNYSIIGISDHGPLTEEIRRKFDSRRMTIDEYYNIYLKDLHLAKMKYKDQIKVLSAVEVEYYYEMKDDYASFLNELDYLVLGQHVFYKDGKYINLYSGNFTKEDLELYAKIVEDALATKQFKIFAHPDLYMWSYENWDEHAINCARRIITTAIKNDVYLEFNANGLRRKRYLMPDGTYNFIYPKIEFWKLLKDEFDYDKILINDDAHSLDDFSDQYTDEAREICKRLNLKVAEEMSL